METSWFLSALGFHHLQPGPTVVDSALFHYSGAGWTVRDMELEQCDCGHLESNESGVWGRVQFRLALCFKFDDNSIELYLHLSCYISRVCGIVNEND